MDGRRTGVQIDSSDGVNSRAVLHCASEVVEEAARNGTQTVWMRTPLMMQIDLGNKNLNGMERKHWRGSTPISYQGRCLHDSMFMIETQPARASFSSFPPVFFLGVCNGDF